jgi:cytochrome c-type biogenesis protein CcmH
MIPRLPVLFPLLLCFALAGPAFAVQPDEMLKDPALEARAREIGKDLRCVVCQNQSIDDSDADLARDLRILLRERLAAGDSDRQAIRFIVDRYGDYVLLKPPFKATTLVLWLAPAIFLLIAGLSAFGFYRRRAHGPAGEAPALTDEEKRRLASLLGEEEKNK